MDDAFLTGLAGAMPIYGNIDIPSAGKGKIGKALRLVVQLVGANSSVQEKVGEIATMMMMRLLNFQKADLPAFPREHGPDIFAKHMNTGIWAMAEAKGGRSKLSKGALFGGTTPLDQMQWGWINHWMNKLANDNNGKSSDGNDIHAHNHTCS